MEHGAFFSNLYADYATYFEKSSSYDFLCPKDSDHGHTIFCLDSEMSSGLSKYRLLRSCSLTGSGRDGTSNSFNFLL